MKIESKLILTSKNRDTGVNLYTFLLVYPRCILAEVNTHRMLSRNTASSRAIPAKKQRKRVIDEPFVPITIGQNQKGMQAGKELEGWRRFVAINTWKLARYPMVAASWILESVGAHKQVVNRIVEPWTWTQQVVTCTDLKNIFKLRNHPDAEPHFHELARQMQEQVERVETLFEVINFDSRNPDGSPCALDDVDPSRGILRVQVLRPGDWHLPFVETREFKAPLSDLVVDVETLKKVSTARCARTSYYLPENGKWSTPDRDTELCGRLASSGHWCYDAATEALTTEGWKAWPEVKPDHKLAIVDISNFSIKFETPSALVKGHFNGKMYGVSGQQVDLFVTPEHRMAVSYRKSGGEWSPFYFERALEVADCPRRYAKSGMLGDRIQTTNPFGVDRATFSKFIGFFIGDGYASGRRVEFNLRLDRKISFLRSLGLPLAEHNKRLKVQIDGLAQWLEEHCYDEDGNKMLPLMYLTAPTDEIESLFCGLRNSDGSEKRNTWVYGSTSIPLLGQIQAVAHLNNLVASIEKVDTRREEQTDYQMNYYRLNFSDRRFPRLDLSQKGRALSYKNEWLPYSGEVYCASVSTGALLVRRNGKVVVSGNSPFEHVATPVPERVYVGNFLSWQQYRKEYAAEHGGDR